MTAEFVNVHGQPVPVSMQALVLKLQPEAELHRRAMKDGTTWFTVMGRKEWEGQPDNLREWLGNGATEEGAWRSAFSALCITALATKVSA